MILGLYRALSVIGVPFIYFLLWPRVLSGKEDSARLTERFGYAQVARPVGRLVWIHAASVGEALSALPLIGRLLERHLDINILITTGTVTSARILGERLPKRARHHYVPIDRPVWVRRFLDLWKPDMAIWIESELWPNMVMETSHRKIPMALVNARLSARSFGRWRLAPRSIAKLLGCFKAILARDEQSAGFLRQLGAKGVICAGDLKQAAEPLPADKTGLSLLQAAIGKRPAWLAASTHPGEETIAMHVHQTLREQFPDLITLIAPRHASRGAEIAKMLAANGLRVARRANQELPDGHTDIYLADTMGEMGLIYRAAPIAFTGGSLAPHGGQNPLEPARLGRAVLHGPHTANFADIYAAMDSSGASQTVTDASSLSEAVAALLSNAQLMASYSGLAQAYADQGGNSVLEEIIKNLEPLVPEPLP